VYYFASQPHLNLNDLLVATNTSGFLEVEEVRAHRRKLAFVCELVYLDNTSKKRGIKLQWLTNRMEYLKDTFKEYLLHIK
jgi:hypothetical protein